MTNKTASHNLFRILLIAIILLFLVPFTFKIDRFPLSNYPMYATSVYRSTTIPTLCSPSGHRLGRFLHPAHPRLAYGLARRSARQERVPIPQSTYFQELSRIYRDLDPEAIRPPYFVNYKLDLQDYFRKTVSKHPNTGEHDIENYDPCCQK